jgi:hypothetical protein
MAAVKQAQDPTNQGSSTGTLTEEQYTKLANSLGALRLSDSHEVFLDTDKKLALVLDPLRKGGVYLFDLISGRQSYGNTSSENGTLRIGEFSFSFANGVPSRKDKEGEIGLGAIPQKLLRSVAGISSRFTAIAREVLWKENAPTSDTNSSSGGESVENVHSLTSTKVSAIEPKTTDSTSLEIPLNGASASLSPAVSLSERQSSALHTASALLNLSREVDLFSVDPRVQKNFVKEAQATLKAYKKAHDESKPEVLKGTPQWIPFIGDIRSEGKAYAVDYSVKNGVLFVHGPVENGQPRYFASPIQPNPKGDGFVSVTYLSIDRAGMKRLEESQKPASNDSKSAFDRAQKAEKDKTNTNTAQDIVPGLLYSWGPTPKDVKPLKAQEATADQIRYLERIGYPLSPDLKPFDPKKSK